MTGALQWRWNPCATFFCGIRILCAITWADVAQCHLVKGIYKTLFVLIKNCIKCLSGVIYLQEVFIMDFSMCVKNKLLELISNAEKNREHFVKNPGKDFSRDRKLTFSKTLFLIICMEAQTLKREPLKMFNFDADTPSAPAFYHLIRSLDIYFQKETYKGHPLAACDGTDLALPMEQGNTVYNCRRKKNQKDYFQIHANAMYGLVNRRYPDIVTEPKKENNGRKTFMTMLGHRNFQEGTIFVMDRGYEGMALLA